MLGGGAGSAFGPAPFLLGGGRGSKKSAPLFPGPQGEPAHGQHPRFVVAEVWADRGLVRGGGGVWLVAGAVEEHLSIPVPHVQADTVTPSGMWLLFGLVFLL